jgi:hypothetical protein
MRKLACRFARLDFEIITNISDNFGFTVLSVGQREAAEFRDYSLLALSVFYRRML